jgi:hypothetical protein
MAYRANKIDGPLTVEQYEALPEEEGWRVDTGFIPARGPDTVRIPDIAFVSAARRPAYSTRGWWQMAPDRHPLVRYQ